MQKQAIIISLLFILVIIFLINLNNENTAKNLSSLPESQTFYISGRSEEPAFTKEVTVNPFNVREGQKQIFSIWAKDSKGISKVTGIISTDKGKEILELSLAEGTNKEGRWESAWTAKNIGNSFSYTTNFHAVNIDGENTNLTLFWNGVK